MLSGFYDFDISSKWEPYVGLGVGWARNHSEYTRAPNINNPDQTIESDVDNLAYSFQAGARYPFSSEWVGELGYRFINFGEVDSGTFSGGDSVTADHHYSHDIVLGMSYLY
jgi:opacity protein-like surface antigen